MLVRWNSDLDSLDLDRYGHGRNRISILINAIIELFGFGPYAWTRIRITILINATYELSGFGLVRLDSE